MKKIVGEIFRSFSNDAAEDFIARIELSDFKWMVYKASIYDEVHKERGRQNILWGKQHHTPEMWMTILMEEVGEAAKEVFEGRILTKPGEKMGNKKLLRDELIQVAAVAVAIIEDLDDEDNIDNWDPTVPERRG